MRKFSLVDFSIRRPKLIIWVTVALARDDNVYLQARYEF